MRTIQTISDAVIRAALLISLLPILALGLTFDVDRIDDTVVDACTGAPNDCTLAGAFAAANSNPGPDTINIPAGIYTVQAGLEITDDVTVVGAGSGECDGSDTCIQASMVPPDFNGLATTSGIPTPATERVLDIENGDATISGVTLRHGNDEFGGGVRIEAGASLDISDCAIDTNAASDGGGGVANFGTLTMTGCQLTNNTAQFFGGGGIWNLGTAMVTSTQIIGPLPLLGALPGPVATTSAPGIPGPPIEDLEDAGFCGGIANFSDLTLVDSIVSGHFGFVGGGICSTPFPRETMTASVSGATEIPVDSILTLRNTNVSNNFAIFGGGIWNRAGSIFLLLITGFSDPTVGNAHLRLENESIVANNLAIAGGGIMNSRTIVEELLSSPCSIQLAQALGVSGGLASSGALGTATAPAAVSMSAIGNATAEVDRSAVVGNNALVGGGILNDQFFVPFSVIYLLDGLAESPAAATSGFPIPGLDSAKVNLLVQDSPIVLNNSPVGAGIASFLTTTNIIGSGVFDNDFFPIAFFFFGAAEAQTSAPGAPFLSTGGGLYTAFGPTSLIDSTVEGNTAAVGGGIASVGGPGGFFLPLNSLTSFLDFFFSFAPTQGTATGSLPLASTDPETELTIEGSTISGNEALADGGGLLNSAALTTALNSTFSGNEASQSGGGVANFDFGHVTLSHVTVTDNTAGASGNGANGASTSEIIIPISNGDGGGIFEDSGNQTIVLRSTIVAGNFDDDDGATPDCEVLSGTIESLGSNIIGEDNGCSGIFTELGDVVDVDAMLGPLTDNGGPTETHQPLDGSPAIDGVSGACEDAAGDEVTTDQRDITRPQGVACDIGSYETACGDGVIDEGTEQCDVGEFDPNDCCSDTCLFESVSYECRPAAGACDIAETCSAGDEPQCPSEDVVEPAGTECRASSGLCDPAELCEGGNACPIDIPFLDSDGDSVCDDLEPEDTEMDPTQVTIQPPGEDPIISATLAGGNCNRIVNFEFIQEIDLPVADEEGAYPDGLVDVSVCSDDDDDTDGDPCDGIPPCTNAQIKITFEASENDFGNGFVYRFFDPTTMEYMPLPNVDLMGNMATLNLTDGGIGDVSGAGPATGAATSGTGGDGIIRDIGGPATAALVVPAPAMSPFAMLLGGLGLLGIAAGALRRRR